MEPNVRFLSSGTTQTGAPAEETVWCYRVATMKGCVDVERPDALKRGPATVSVRPIRPKASGRHDAEERETVGTPAWIQKSMAGSKVVRRFLWTARVSDRQYSLEVPLFEDATVMAWAPGHCVEVIRLDAGTAPGGTVQVNFNLRAGPTANIRVLDEAGVPIAGASVQFVQYWTQSTNDLDIEALELRKSVSGCGFGFIGNDERGTSLVDFIASGRTGKDGRATLHQGGSDGSLLLLVAAPGRVPHLRKLARPDECADAEVRLSRNVPAMKGYRLSCRGQFASSRSSLSLLEPVEGLTLNIVALEPDGDGVFPAESIVPNKEYFAMLTDKGALGMKFGSVRFGSEEIVDISHFE